MMMLSFLGLMVHDVLEHLVMARLLDCLLIKGVLVGYFKMISRMAKFSIVSCLLLSCRR